MRLTPKHPPGRFTRKARAFEAEIGRLRADGYTCEAIREALAETGVNVSKSTVQREAARHSKHRASVDAAAAITTIDRDRPPSPAETTRPSHPLADDLRSGRDIAEAFVRNRITNPLLRLRSSDEGSRH